MEQLGGKERNIKEGLQIPTKPVHKTTFKAKEVVLEPVLTNDQIKAREGSYFDESDIKHLIEEDTDVYGLDPDTGNKKLLAKFRKNVIPHDMIEKGWEGYYITSSASRNQIGRAHV